MEPVAGRDSARARATISRARARAPPRDPVARAGERARAKLDAAFLHQHQIPRIRSYFLESDFLSLRVASEFLTFVKRKIFFLREKSVTCSGTLGNEGEGGRGGEEKGGEVIH